MRPDQRTVTQMPISQLWSDSGDLSIARKRELGRKQIAELLRGGPVRFVVANCGDPLRWIDSGDTFRFWKEEMKPRPVEPSDAKKSFRLESHPDEYCYLATEWDTLCGSSVVLFEMCH